MAGDFAAATAEVRMMDYRLQLFPISGTGDTEMSLSELWDNLPANWEDANVFPSRLVCNSGFDSAHDTRRSNRNTVLGIGLAVIASASFWIAAGLMVARLWR